MQTGKIMRPQQNRRMRNQNNNRKSPNPLSKNYESNGPDIKIRGTAQHIADKYMTLARDAQAASDHVMAENYLQHAEHYNRIILAAQAQISAQANNEEKNEQQNKKPIQENNQEKENNVRAEKTKSRKKNVEKNEQDNENPSDLENEQITKTAQESPKKPRSNRKTKKTTKDNNDENNIPDENISQTE